MVAARDWREERWGGAVINWDRVSVGEDEKSFGGECGDVCTTVKIYLIPLCT